jgi:hypothetical protein
MQVKGARLYLQAGHAQTIGTIFSGDVRSVEHRIDGATTVTRVRSGDGERAYQYAFVTRSFAGGTKVADVMAYIVRAMGVQPGNALSKAAAYRGTLEQFANGYVVHGKASTEFARLMKTLGLEWSVQDGVLQVLEPSEVAAYEALVLSPESGLIGSPEQGTPEKKGGRVLTKAKALLHPELKPGRKVILESRGTQGVFKLVKVTHRGDTHSGDWTSEIECVPTHDTRL